MTHFRGRRSWPGPGSVSRPAGGEAPGPDPQRRPRMDRFAMDVAQTVVEMIRRHLTDSSASWQSAPVCQPRNIVYGTTYRGLNAILLAVQARRNGQPDLRFLTAHALERLRDGKGDQAKLKPGAPAYRIWTPYRLRPVRLAHGASLDRYAPENLERRPDGSVWYQNPRLYFTTKTVYSIADTTAVHPPLPGRPLLEAFEENAFFETFLDACGTQVEEGGGESCYDMGRDLVRVPERGSFVSSAEYYATLMHEFFHWTGARTREGRIESTRFGTKAYAQEELRAEIFSAMCSVMFGLGHLPRAADYIGNWNETLGSDPRSVYMAALEAHRMLVLVCDVADGRRPTQGWLAAADFSRVPTPLRDARLAGHNPENEWRREMGLALRDSRGAQLQPVLEVVVAYRNRVPGSRGVQGEVALPTSLARAQAGELVRLLERSASARGFVPEDLGLPSLARGGASCFHTLFAVTVREPGEGRPAGVPDRRAPATFEAFAAAFLGHDAEGWNAYDPSRRSSDLPAVYSGPGYVPVAGERVRALLSSLGGPGPDQEKTEDEAGRGQTACAPREAREKEPDGCLSRARTAPAAGGADAEGRGQEARLLARAVPLPEDLAAGQAVPSPDGGRDDSARSPGTGPSL